MTLDERQKLFLEAIQKQFGVSAAVRPKKLFGVSNSAKNLEGGIQLGVVNLEKIPDDVEAVILACVIRFPPEDEVYFAVLIRKERQNLLKRLREMKERGAAAKTAAAPASATSDDEEDVANEGAIKYAERNNNVPVYLATNGKLWLRNAGFWDTLAIDLTDYAPSIEIDEVLVAVYPPTASARRSLLAREFVGWLGKLAGHEKVREIEVWPDPAALSGSMRRMPKTVPIGELEDAVKALGGHYAAGEVRQIHGALNALDHKHFVIIPGVSGTGKTTLATKYALATHGLTKLDDDPLLFICSVRPEWTDPTALTGYFDVLTNRYVVPRFLEALLVATAHRDSPVFVVIDELNLARVEYFLSDVLSAMETGAPLQLHSNSVPLEGTTGSSIPASLPLPENLYLIGTTNVDESTNPISDKVLDRAAVVEVAAVDVSGFLQSLERRFPELKAAVASIGPKLSEIHALMREHGLEFGYRTVEECVRHAAFDAEFLQSPVIQVMDFLLTQRVFTKLRGSERQRSLLVSLRKAVDGLVKSTALIERLQADLEEFGSFQSMR